MEVQDPLKRTTCKIPFRVIYPRLQQRNDGTDQSLLRRVWDLCLLGDVLGAATKNLVLIQRQ